MKIKKRHNRRSGYFRKLKKRELDEITWQKSCWSDEEDNKALILLHLLKYDYYVKEKGKGGMFGFMGKGISMVIRLPGHN